MINFTFTKYTFTTKLKNSGEHQSCLSCNQIPVTFLAVHLYLAYNNNDYLFQIPGERPVKRGTYKGIST